jgi:hypothetical protein
MPTGPVGAADLLDAAAICRNRSLAEAAVYLACLGQPELSWERCAALPIGERDSALVAMRAALFGPQLELGAACPGCRARLDVRLTTDALTFEAPVLEALPTVLVDGRVFGVRPADSRDFALLAAIADPQQGRELLARRCLVALDGGPGPSALTAEEMGAVAVALETIDPAGDPYVSLGCVACGTTWNAPVDIGQILTADIEDAARALLDEVHDLARAYHWSETAILGLPAERRQAYLQRVRG